MISAAKEEGNMNNLHVDTIFGPFDKERLEALKEVIRDQPKDKIVMFEGQELFVQFGVYLAEFVEAGLS